MKKILVLEDDTALCAGVCLALQSDDTATTPCHSIAEGAAALQRQRFDLLVLDINLPDGNGLDFLRSLRQTDTTPALMLTANDLELDIVTGLESGADDYITKPFSLAVLRARVAALLRRGEIRTGSIYRHGAFCFDFDRMVFHKNDTLLELSRTEQKLLRLLVANCGQTLPRALLLERIWGDECYVDENALSVTVKRLRDKLEDTSAKAQYLRTVYGIGYVWKEPAP